MEQPFIYKYRPELLDDYEMDPQMINLFKTFIAIDNLNRLVIYPVHLNPKVQKPVERILSDVSNIILIDPLAYQDFIWIMNRSKIIITDSGGVQEEAPSLGKPVLVVRDTTERPEAVHAGTVLLVGTNEDLIVSTTFDLLKNQSKLSINVKTIEFNNLAKIIKIYHFIFYAKIIKHVHNSLIHHWGPTHIIFYLCRIFMIF